MKKIYKSFIFFLLISSFTNAQTNLSVGTDENLTVSNGGILTVNNISFEPTSTVSFSNTNITEVSSTANTTNIDNINKVLVSTGNIENFTGQITVGYTTAQLNGISESSLQLTFFDLVWNPSVLSTVNVGAKTVSSSFSGISFSELTLQGLTNSISPATTTPTTTTSSSGSGGSSSTPSIDPNDTDGDGIANSLDVFPNDPNEWEDTDGDGFGNNGDPDDDNDGVFDVFESEYITIYRTLYISVEPINTDKIQNIPEVFPFDKGVGKWKIRKKIVGGADAYKFIISEGDPASQGILQQQKNSDLPDGVLKLKTIPDFSNPADHNRDNIYEVEIAFINTTANDKRVPVPSFNLNISLSNLSTNVVTLTTNPVDITVYGPENVSSDTDADLSDNPFDKDDDGDGIFSDQEGNDPNLDGNDSDALDTDGDGFADYLDPDDDNDGVFSLYEGTDPDGDFDPADAIDSDGDGTPDYLDPDDDNDGIDSVNETPDENLDGDPLDAQDFDGDGTPDYLDTDDDGDGVNTVFELDATGIPLDTDGDGIIDALDTDDDGDGLLTADEDINGNGDPRDDDTDNDGIANYLESSLLDEDQDGVVDELDSVNDDPYNDQDGDGYANMDEKLAGTNPLDPNSFPQGFSNPSLRASIDIVSFFSPNSDGINDTWQVKEIDRYPDNQVWIFTRSGYEVFNTQNYRNNWSGTKDGTPLPEGSYYYRIDLDGNGTIDFEGWLYLTR